MTKEVLAQKIRTVVNITPKSIWVNAKLLRKSYVFIEGHSVSTFAPLEEPNYYNQPYFSITVHISIGFVEML